MKRAKVFVDECLAGYLIEVKQKTCYEFRYLDDYLGAQISCSMPTNQKVYHYDQFPPFFDGFLPEGMMLDALLKKTKLDRDDCFEQLMRVGGELVGNVRVERD